MLGFFRPKWISVTKSAKKNLPPLVAICDQKHANRIPRLSVVVSANVKATAKRLDYYAEITNLERSFGSNGSVVSRCRGG